MVAQPSQPRYMTVDEWRQLEEHSHDVKYVLVSTRRQLVEVFQRTQEGWTTYHVYGPGDEIELTSIDVHLSLAALYELTDVPEIVETPKGEV